MSMIGHNNGPSMEPGAGFRKLAWQKARSELLPTLPLEIVRLRVARAKRLGLPYKTYASIRAASGRDIVAFLFSSNALELRPRALTLPQAVASRLTELPAKRLAAIYAPAAPDAVLTANPNVLDAAGRAPDIFATWGETRARLRTLARDKALPPDGVVVVAATTLEVDWCASAGFAGVVGAAQIF